MKKVKCPCCGYYTLDEELYLFAICHVCFWQFDEVAHDRADISIGANKISLNQARENYEKYGICKKEFKQHVREPYPEEFPENNL